MLCHIYTISYIQLYLTKFKLVYSLFIHLLYLEYVDNKHKIRITILIPSYIQIPHIYDDLIYRSSVILKPPVYLQIYIGFDTIIYTMYISMIIGFIRLLLIELWNMCNDISKSLDCVILCNNISKSKYT